MGIEAQACLVAHEENQGKRFLPRGAAIIVLITLLFHHLTSFAQTDIFAFKNSPNQIAVYESDGAGGFSGPQFINMPSTDIHAIAVDDFNNDLKLDVLTLCVDGSVKVILATGDGGWEEPYTIAGGLILGANDLATGDLNSDTYPDILIPSHNQIGDTQIYLLTSTQSDDFNLSEIPIAWTLGIANEGMSGIDCGHINSDNHVDFAVAHYNRHSSENDIHIFAGNGLGQFSELNGFSNSNPDGTPACIVGEFVSGASADVIVGQDDGGDPGQTWTYIADGMGQFVYFDEAYDTNVADETGDNEPGNGHADAFDFNGDGALDIVASASNIGILLFTGLSGGQFTEGELLSTGSGSISCPPSGWSTRNHAPKVRNITVHQIQNTQFYVVVNYDLYDIDGDLLNVTLKVSSDGGETWNVPVKTVEGDIGAGIQSGANKQIIWSASIDYPGIDSSEIVARVLAYDGH
ncbi:MAG: VCBS repeat-containing protein [bacterium]|nr:VCBS repeat-containing protein [bacterium]